MSDHGAPPCSILDIGGPNKGEQPTAAEICSLIKSVSASEGVQWNRARITVVGEGRMGKTSTLKCLTGQPFDVSQKSTRGCETTKVSISNMHVGKRDTFLKETENKWTLIPRTKSTDTQKSQSFELATAVAHEILARKELESKAAAKVVDSSIKKEPELARVVDSRVNEELESADDAPIGDIPGPTNIIIP